jgi:hypothetical protein
MVARSPADCRGNWSLGSETGLDAGGRRGPHSWLLGLFLTFMVACAAPVAATAEPFKATVSADVSGGYARLVFHLSDEIDASAQIAGSVLIIAFDKPISISLDLLSAQASAYVAAARRDPDGRAIRVALARKVTVNSITAGDKLFVDLLPDTWSGPPPGLPQEIVEELARRAREAERFERLARRAEQEKKAIPVAVHVADQPTFTRYVFDVPDQTSVSADRGKDRLTLSFDAPLALDLSDAEAALPATVATIHAEAEQDSTLVRFSFLAAVDLRMFRDGKSYVVDIVKNDAAASARAKAAANPLPAISLEVGPASAPSGASISPDAGAMPVTGMEKSSAVPPALSPPNMPAPVAGRSNTFRHGKASGAVGGAECARAKSVGNKNCEDEACRSDGRRGKGGRIQSSEIRSSGVEGSGIHDT